MNLRLSKLLTISVFLSIIAFCGCTKEIVIPIPTKEYIMVINSTIAPFTMPYSKGVYVEVKKSIHISDTTQNTIISDAKVVLYENDSLIQVLNYVDSLKHYTIDEFWFPQMNKEYKIEVNHPDYKSINAVSEIPKKVNIADTVITPIVFINDFGDITNEVAVTFNDPVDDINYYEVVLMGANVDFLNTENYYRLSSSDNLILRESYYPPLERFDIEKPKSLLFTDIGINGEQHTLKFTYQAPRMFDNSGNHMPSHYITVNFRSITQEYYLFKTSLIQHTNGQEVDILYGGKEPSNIYTNIEDGYGLFSGFNYDMAVIFIEQIDY